MNKRYKIIVVSLVLFIGCLAGGFALAKQKPLWNDEIHTQTSTIQNRSYLDIVLAYRGEGNSYPLFYLLQKGLTNLLDYRFPVKWKHEWTIKEPKSQIILRIIPNFFMSLSVVLIFFYFSWHYTQKVGFYSLLLSLSSYMILAYWVEARPYALWVFLTTIQALLFLQISQAKRVSDQFWNTLICVHFLLSITIAVGVVQITIVSVLLFLLKEKNWKKHILLTFIPICIGIFYYLKSPKRQFTFIEGPMQLVGASIPKDRLFLIILYMALLLILFFRYHGGFKQFFKHTQLQGWNCLMLTMLMMLSAFAILAIFKINESPGEGFQISNRYFIYLAPIGVIAITLFSVDFYNIFKDKLIYKCMVIFILGFFVVFRSFRTYELIRGYYGF